jgi:hypothetical protein
MSPHVIATLVEAVIPIGGGLYGTLLGLRVIGKKPGVDPNYDLRMNKVSGILQICGPLMIVFGIVMAAVNLARK